MGGGGWGGVRSGGCIKKAMKNCHEFNKISTLTSNKNSLEKAMKLGFFFTVILNHLALLLKRDTRKEGSPNYHTGGASY